MNKQGIYLLEVALSGIRCFTEKVNISFSDTNQSWKRWNVILGDNSVGKTTLLQSIDFLCSLNFEKQNADLIAINKETLKDWEAFKFRILDSKFMSENLRFKSGLEILGKLSVYNGKKKSIIQNGIFMDDSVHFKTDAQPLNLVSNCFGYGASRTMSRTSATEEYPKASITLFIEGAKLINAEDWLVNLDYAASKESKIKETSLINLKRVKQLLIDVLPDIDNIKISIPEPNKKPIVEFHTPFGWTKMKNLSLGYKTMAAWIVDLVARLFERYPESKNPLAEPAIVLIDEIDLHLHPKWQRQVFKYLSEKFTSTQFIVTSHSPLIVQSLPKDSNIILLHREDDKIVVNQNIEDVRKWRIDQILSSELFDTPVRSEEIEIMLNRRKVLIEKKKLTKKEIAELAELNAKADLLPSSESQTDIEAKEIIRKVATYLKDQQKAND